MNKGIMGAIFLLIATMFYSVRYICASIGLSNSDTWTLEEFNVILKNVPNNLLVFSIVFLLVGLIFIIWELWNLKNKNHN